LVDLKEIRSDLEYLYKKARENPDMPEEELRAIFNKGKTLENLGYKSIGKDIRLEHVVKGKRSDITCLDDYGNVIFVAEFKKPSDITDLKDHFDQLWDRYVKPLRADFGLLINGYELILYKRIGENNQLILKTNLSEISDSHCELIYKLLKKPDYSLTQVKSILEYFAKFASPESRIYLTTDAARNHFFQNFKLEDDSAFGNLLKRMIKLFDFEYGRSKFLKSAYDFWRKSYAKKPDKIPESWKKLLKSAELKNTEEDLYKFMFCLETTYALFTRLILAKACEDYKFPGIDFSSFIRNRILGSERRGGTFLVVWGVLVMHLIRNMRRDLVESVFEEDIFYWWTDDFEALQDADRMYRDERSHEEALFEFSRSLARVLYTLYKFDFSQIIGDPLGDLYQKYFDKETRKALGEFYTPKEVVEYIVDAVDYRGRGIVEKRLLDPACGSGTFLVDALKRYLNEAAPIAEEKGWDYVLSKLCNEYHIVGFDIHPFATIMAQIQFMLVLIPKYKEAIEHNRNFVLKRLPIFRTDSLIDESKSEAMTLGIFEGGRSLSIKLTLPVRAGDKFADTEIIMPYRGEAISEKTGLLNIPEYFAALQALFDTVKEAARAEPEKQVIAHERLENNFKIYLQNKDWARLAGFFMPYGRYFLDTIKKLRSEYGDGRLVKSIEDIILAGLLKNHVEYDFLVGNPPYVRVQMLDEAQKNYYKSTYESATGKFDLYILFIERGIKWLKNDGKFGFITSNKFIQASYGIDIRNFILKSTVISQFIDFGDTGVFKDATNYPCIFILEKDSTKQKTCNYVRVKIPHEDILTYLKEKFTRSSFSDKYIDYFKVEQSMLKGKTWNFMPQNELNLIKKIETLSSHTLKNLRNNISEGIVTGQNPVFILSDETIKKYNIEKGIVKHVIGGSEIKRWQISWNGNYIIYPHFKYSDKLKPINLKDFANLKNYFEERKIDLEKRHYVLEAGKEWFELWNPRDPDIFEAKPKIVTPDISTNNSFAMDFEGKWYCLDTCFIIVLKEEFLEYYSFLIALLNSNILEFYFKQISPFISGGYYRYKTQYLEQLPIRLPQTSEEESLALQITARVEQILTRIKSEQRAAHFPDEYIREYRARGEEFDPVEIVFNANHKELAVDIEKSLDKEFLVKIKGAAPIAVDSEAKAEYLKAALAGRKVSKGEKITILIPRADSLAKEALAQREKDAQEAQGIAALEDEINELMYRLYGLDENDKKVIEEFLTKF